MSKIFYKTFMYGFLYLNIIFWYTTIIVIIVIFSLIIITMREFLLSYSPKNDRLCPIINGTIYIYIGDTDSYIANEQ